MRSIRRVWPDLSNTNVKPIWHYKYNKLLIMELIFNKIIETLNANKERFREKGLKPVQFIDIYDGQPQEAEEYEFTLPAIFDDYGVVWERSGNVKHGAASIDIHILADKGCTIDSLRHDREKGMKRFRFYNLVADLLENIETAHSTKMSLVSERPIATDYFQYHKLTFSCTLQRRYEKERSQGVLEKVKTPKYIID